MTKQKRIIYDIVATSMEHPTADFVHAQARRKLPRISLATIYRNLKVLCQEGSILEIISGKGRSSSA